MPTLTQTVEHIPPDASAQPVALPPESPPAPAVSADTGMLPGDQQEDRLEDKINALIAKHLAQLQQEIREEIKATLKQQRAKPCRQAQEDGGV